jgi:hypothetical protein
VTSEEEVSPTLTAIPAHLVLGAVDLVVSCIEAHTLAAPTLPFGQFFEAWRHWGESANKTYLNPVAATPTPRTGFARMSVRAHGNEVVGGFANEAALDLLLALAMEARHFAGASDVRW